MYIVRAFHLIVGLLFTSKNEPDTQADPAGAAVGGPFVQKRRTAGCADRNTEISPVERVEEVDPDLYTHLLA
jgi:hypothetical protein